MKLPKQDSATGRAVKTTIQAVVGFLIGLIVTIWTVPGVPEAVINYVSDNLIQVLILIGVPSGITSFLWNYIRKDIANY